MQHQPVILERTANPLRFGKPGRSARLAALRRLVERDAVPAALLGLVHGKVGVGKHLDFGHSVENRDADAGSNPNGLIGEHGPLPAQCLDQFIRHRASLCGLGLRQQHGKFVPTNPGQQVRLAQTLAQQHRDPLEDIITGLVSERVVNVLEIVEIDHQYGARSPIASHSFGLLG